VRLSRPNADPVAWVYVDCDMFAIHRIELMIACIQLSCAGADEALNKGEAPHPGFAVSVEHFVVPVHAAVATVDRGNDALVAKDISTVIQWITATSVNREERGSWFGEAGVVK